MSTQLAETQKTWPELVQDAMPKFQQIAQQNKLVRWQEESEFAIQSLQKNQLLAKCAPYTVQNAIVNVAAVGLTLNPADGYAYLVPEYNKQTRQNECQLRISFKGLVKSATDTGSISWVKAEIVKTNDTFKYNGPCSMPEHTMDPFSKDRGESIGVYCIAKTCEGEALVDVMAWEEVQKIKGCAKTELVWQQWPDEMAKKAIIKRAAKQWPKTEKSGFLHKAVEVINEHEGSEPIAAYTEEQKTAFDGFIEADDALGMRMFSDYVGQDVFTELFNSAPKGEKMKLKKKVRELESIGAALFKAIEQAIIDDDGLAAIESMDGLTDTGEALLKKKLGTDTWDTLNNYIQEAA